MTTITDLHRALADQAKHSIALDFNVFGWPFSGGPLPRIEVWPAPNYIDYFEESYSDSGLMRVRWRFRIDIAAPDAETTFLQMTALLAPEGPSSLRAAVMNEPTLSGRADDSVVLSAEWPTDEANLAQTAWVNGESVVTKGWP